MRDGNVLTGSRRWIGPSEKDHPDCAWDPSQAVAAHREVKYAKVQKLVTAEQTTPPAPPAPPPTAPELAVEPPATPPVPPPVSPEVPPAAKPKPAPAKPAPKAAPAPTATSAAQAPVVLSPLELVAPIANRIPSGRVVEMRPANAARRLPIAGPAGTLRIKAVVTSQPVAFSGSLELLPATTPGQQTQGQAAPFRWGR